MIEVYSFYFSLAGIILHLLIRVVLVHYNIGVKENNIFDYKNFCLEVSDKTFVWCNKCSALVLEEGRKRVKKVVDSGIKRAGSFVRRRDFSDKEYDFVSVTDDYEKKSDYIKDVSDFLKRRKGVIARKRNSFTKDFEK